MEFHIKPDVTEDKITLRMIEASDKCVTILASKGEGSEKMIMWFDSARKKVNVDARTLNIFGIEIEINDCPPFR